jgi:hypothetical protein
LKDDNYVQSIEHLARVGTFYSRDNTRFDLGYDEFLVRNVSLLDNPNSRQQVKEGIDFIRQFYQSYHYIGSLEFHLWMDEQLISNDLASGLFKAYYRAWQEYCYKSYAPVVTVNSERIRYSYGKINVGTKSDPNEVIAFLYSPAIFLHFLEWQLGRGVSRILLSLSPSHIQSIRNGDGAWNRFKEKYHSCVEMASELHALESEVWKLRHEFTENHVNSLIELMFKNKVHKLDTNTILDFLSMMSVPLAWILQLFNPAAILTFLLKHLFKKTASAPFSNDAIAFYRKAVSLTKAAPVMSAI